MFKWLIDNIKGVHFDKRKELDDDEYWKFMIDDFNNRLKFAVFISFIIGFVSGIWFMYVVCNF